MEDLCRCGLELQHEVALAPDQGGLLAGMRGQEAVDRGKRTGFLGTGLDRAAQVDATDVDAGAGAHGLGRSLEVRQGLEQAADRLEVRSHAMHGGSREGGGKLLDLAVEHLGARLVQLGTEQTDRHGSSGVGSAQCRSDLTGIHKFERPRAVALTGGGHVPGVEVGLRLGQIGKAQLVPEMAPSHHRRRPLGRKRCQNLLGLVDLGLLDVADKAEKLLLVLAAHGRQVLGIALAPALRRAALMAASRSMRSLARRSRTAKRWLGRSWPPCWSATSFGSMPAAAACTSRAGSILGPNRRAVGEPRLW